MQSLRRVPEDDTTVLGVVLAGEEIGITSNLHRQVHGDLVSVENAGPSRLGILLQDMWKCVVLCFARTGVRLSESLSLKPRSR